jgi:hypothetical protein
MAPTLTLGVTTLAVSSFTNTTIVAKFSSSLAAGTYLLTVMNHPYSYSGVFIVTNGAVGPQGTAGLVGAKGPTGAAGTNGGPARICFSPTGCSVSRWSPNRWA